MIRRASLILFTALFLVSSALAARPVIGVTVSARDRGGYEYVSLSASVIDSIDEAGGLPVLLPPIKSLSEIDGYVTMVDGFVFTGGADINPARYGEKPHETVSILLERREDFDFALMERALASGKPVLGICLGMQEMNVACGGTLIQDIPSETDSTLVHRGEGSGHDVILEKDSRLAGFVGETEFPVNSRHHQAVERVGEGLRVVAKAPDGIIEGIEKSNHPFAIGVQWHPESMMEAPHRRLFRELVFAARSDSSSGEVEEASSGGGE